MTGDDWTRHIHPSVLSNFLHVTYILITGLGKKQKTTYQLPIWPAAWAELPLAPYSNYVCLKTVVFVIPTVGGPERSARVTSSFFFVLFLCSQTNSCPRK